MRLCLSLVFLLVFAPLFLPAALSALTPSETVFSGNLSSCSYQCARRLMYEHVYRDHRRTIYCDFPFAEDRSLLLPQGFFVPAYQDRAQRVETEHLVPVENFGRTFREWREGDPQCRDAEGRPFKGRKCAERCSEEFRRMEADLHNLFPAVGAVNALRRNYTFQMLGQEAELPFGAICPMRFFKRHVEPPERARGVIARTHLYMETSYERFRLSRQQRRLMESWNRLYPPDTWECERDRRIARFQGNHNPFIRAQCAARAGEKN